MGLPACQQRVLDYMEGALKASEPHLAAMFAIFARLSLGEPVGTESLAADRRRRWWLRPGATVTMLVLVPVLFALIITGVLLGGPTRASTCAVGMPAAGAVPRGSQSSCGGPGKHGQRTASSAGAAVCSGSAGPAGTVTTAHFALWARDAAAAWPSGAGPSGLC
jgi:hypothetical protein